MAAKKQIRSICRVCQRELTLVMSKPGYYDGQCECGEQWQIPDTEMLGRLFREEQNRKREQQKR